jgi:hypothetical protein
LFPLDQLEGFLAVEGPVDDVAVALQGERDEVENVRVVVGDHDHAALALAHVSTIGFAHGSG